MDPLMSKNGQPAGGDPIGGGPITITKGESQPTRCRDPFFALLFYASVIAVAVLAGVYGNEALDATTDPDHAEQWTNYLYGVLVLGAVSLVLSGFGFFAMLCCPAFLIKLGLLFALGLSALWMVMAFVVGSIWVGIIGILFFALSLCYTCMVWGRIPFATANLVTAISAIKSNCGITVVAYGFTIVAVAFTFVWSLAFVGLFDHTYNCVTVTGTGQTVCTQTNYGLLFALLVPYFFAHQVFTASIHVTVAGTVGTWWYAPEETGFCASSITGSLCRTMTTSFGSICFGSLLVALLQALKSLAYTARGNDDCALFACCAECILSCLEAYLEYFNKWAYIYVGLYGYGYIEAGRNVITLLHNRGWEAIIADNLVSNTLMLVSFVVGGLNGCIGLAVAHSTDWFADETISGEAEMAQGVGFTFGFLVGLVVCSVLMSTIGSAVNTVIVLFAEGPREFEHNYPELSAEMRRVWSEIYPGSV